MLAIPSGPRQSRNERSASPLLNPGFPGGVLYPFPYTREPEIRAAKDPIRDFKNPIYL